MGGAEHPATAAAHHKLGMLMQSMGRNQDALTHYRDALAIVEKLGHTDRQAYRKAIASLEADGSAKAMPASALVPVPAPAASPEGAKQTDGSAIRQGRASAYASSQLLPASLRDRYDREASDGEKSDQDANEEQRRSRDKCVVM